MDRMNSLIIFFIAFCWCYELRHVSPVVAVDVGVGVDVDVDADTIYPVCIEQCGENGCVGQTCFKQCNYSSLEARSWCRQQPAYEEWNHWVCETECRYHCTVYVDHQRQILGLKPQKFQRKWPANSFQGIQEPIPAALSGVSLAMHFHGWVKFVVKVNYNLPLRPNTKSTFYEYTGLWHVYALIAMNGWFWAGAFHFRDVELTEKFDSISRVVFLAYSVFLAIVRSFGVTNKVTRLLVATPILTFAGTHIIYMNFYKFDHRLDTVVCILLSVTNKTLWCVLVGVTRHPSRWKIWFVAMGGGAPMLIMRVHDWPPYWGFLDAHCICHAIMIPIIFLSWDFVRDDSEFRTLLLVNKKKN